MPAQSSDVRFAELEVETSHARVQIVLDLDGGTRRDLATGIGAMDHMLRQFAFFAGCDIGLSADGDLHVDDHHLVEALGMAVGRAIKDSLADAAPVERLGSAHGVAEDGLVLVAVDLKGQGALHYQVSFERERLGLLATESVREFFRLVAAHSGMTMHIHQLAGSNDYHVCEAIFKGFGAALARAARRSEHHRTQRAGSGAVD